MQYTVFLVTSDFRQVCDDDVINEHVISYSKYPPDIIMIHIHLVFAGWKIPFFVCVCILITFIIHDIQIFLNC